jgi:hypothetical protein
MAPVRMNNVPDTLPPFGLPVSIDLACNTIAMLLKTQNDLFLYLIYIINEVLHCSYFAFPLRCSSFWYISRISRYS